MAYTDWTFSGSGTNVSQVTATSPSDITWGAQLPQPQFGNYCRKLTGGIYSPTDSVWELINPQYMNVPVGSTELVDAYFSFQRLADPNTVPPYSVNINETQFALISARSKFSIAEYGYMLGFHVFNNPFGYSYGYPVLRFRDGSEWLLGIYGGFMAPSFYSATTWCPFRLSVESVDANNDIVNAYVEVNGSNQVTPGTGNWVPCPKMNIYAGPGYGGVTQVGGFNSTGDILVPSTSACFAPHFTGSTSQIYWSGWTDMYIDGFRKEIIP